MFNVSKYLGSSILRKLLLTFIAITIPLYCIGIGVYYISLRTVREEIENSMITRTSFFLDSIDSELSRINILQSDCLSDKNLNSLTNLSSIMSLYEKTNSMLRLQQRMSAIKNSSAYIEEATAHISTINKSISAWNGVTELNFQYFNNIANALNNETGMINYIYGTRMLSTLPVIGKEGQLPLYILDIELSEAQLLKSLEYNDRDKPGKTVLLDLMNDFSINTYGNEEIVDAIKIWISSNKHDEISGKGYLQLMSSKYFVVFSKSTLTNLYVLNYIPEEQIVRDLRKMSIWFWLFPFAAILTILSYSLSIVRIVQKPLRTLVKSFSIIKEGKLSHKIQYIHNDEFKDLYSSFNDMVEKLRILIDQVYKQKILKQKAEMKQLQSQINPHFLYNSFFILNTMAVLGDNENIEKFTVQLGEYFKFITRNAMDDVRLQDEIRHARTYTEIQAMRFANRVNVSFDELPKELYDIMVPQLIIQPLIENAFEHGIEKMTENGILSIQFDFDDNKIDIVIKDNGSGIDFSRLVELKNNLTLETDAETTGIINIHKRLVLKYGNGSGIFVNNNELGGLETVVRIMRRGEQ